MVWEEDGDESLLGKQDSSSEAATDAAPEPELLVLTSKREKQTSVTSGSLDCYAILIEEN